MKDEEAHMVVRRLDDSEEGRISLNISKERQKERNEGRWIICDDGYVFCENCGNTTVVPNKYETPLEQGYLFCPYCGSLNSIEVD